MRRLLATAAGVGVLILSAATPAFAHATLDKHEAAAGEESDFTLHVPSEIDGQHNVKVILELPDNFEFRNCIAPGNWQCTLTTEGDPPKNVITWTPVPGNDQGIETFQFRVLTRGSAGVAKFEVNQFYSNGTVVQWDGDPDAEHPAPTVTLTGGSGTQNDGPANDHVDTAEDDGQMHATDATTGEPESTTNETDGPTNAGDTLGTGDATTSAEVTSAAAPVDDKKSTNWGIVGLIAAMWLLGVVPVSITGTRNAGHDAH